MTSTRFLIKGLALELVFGGTAVCASDKDRTARQQELDAACERARTKRRDPEQQKLAAECVASARGSQAESDAEFLNYGERFVNRPPLFYNLPECEAAIDFHKSARRNR